MTAMTDEKVETPRVYRWDSKGMSMDEHPGYCQYVDKSDYDAKCAELERVKGERDLVSAHEKAWRSEWETTSGILHKRVEQAEQRAEQEKARADRAHACIRDVGRTDMEEEEWREKHAEPIKDAAIDAARTK